MFTPRLMIRLMSSSNRYIFTHNVPQCPNRYIFTHNVPIIRLMFTPRLMIRLMTSSNRYIFTHNVPQCPNRYNDTSLHIMFHSLTILTDYHSVPKALIGPLTCFMFLVFQGLQMVTFTSLVEIFASQYRTFTGLGVGFPWAVGIMTFSLFSYLIKDWRYIQLMSTSVCLFQIGLVW